MTNSKLAEILQCIHCNGNQLTTHPEMDGFICGACSATYEITDGVPLFLKKGLHQESADTEIHLSQGTSFHYIDHYQKDALSFDYFSERDAGTEHLDRRVREHIIAGMPDRKGRIIDIGCGKAWVAEWFCPKGYEVVSMDISLENTSRALRKYPWENHAAVSADVYTLPFRDNTFDYIIASEVIEHVPDPVLFIRRLFRILKPGGAIIVTTPYREKLSFTLCVHCNKPTPFNAHLHSFDEKILTGLYGGDDLKACDFRTFGNKILIHLRIHAILNHLGFGLWKIIDHAMNRIFYKPSRIIVRWHKR